MSENTPETGCIVLPAFPQWGSQQEAKVAPVPFSERRMKTNLKNESKNLWGAIDNFDANGVPAGVVPVGSIPNVDKSRMTEESKLRMAKVCAKAKTGYYTDLERYKNTTDPAERARLGAILDEKEAQAERQFADEQGKKYGAQ